MPLIVEAENLKKTFGDFVAVDGVSFQVFQGECFGILGPNGAGKTSTIRMIYGFSPLSGGSLKVFGLNAAKELRAIKSRVGVCQQENNLDPDLTVQQNFEVFARYFDIPKREAQQRAGRLLRFIALDHRMNAKVPELSGGMMRRLVVARALINEPDLLILDEPTTGLDPQSRHQVWERLEQLRSKGLTILLTTHYMDEAFRLCDRLVIMDHGRILVEGKPIDLIKRYVGQNVLEVTAPTDELRSFVQSQGLKHEDLRHRLIIYGQESDHLWGATKSVIATGIMLGVVSLFGLIEYPQGLLVVPLSLVGGMAFGSIGMYFTGIVPNIEIFNLPIFLFITPMFLFSGTFFPVENLPVWAQRLALLLPLTHLVKLTRSFCFGMIDSGLLWNFLYILVFSLVFFPLAILKMHRRLIK